jgi:3',5'-nucleoside bisphosphate phosphatase
MRAMRANLHLHSLRSDGTTQPACVAEAAAAVGLEAAALTDHDTFGGVPEFLEIARGLGLEAWPGAEIDVVDSVSGYKGEILAYFPQGSYDATQKLLDRVARLRRARTRSWMKKAPEVFRREDLSFDDLVRFKTEMLSGTGVYSLGKTDLFRYLKSRGALSPTTEYREFKKAFFDSGLLPNGKYRKPELSEVVDTVQSDGGICVLPHPGHEYDDSLAVLKKNESAFISLLERFRKLGVRGVELYWYRNGDTNGINRIVGKVASDLGLFLTYGSDCHGPGSGKYTIRDFHGDFAGWPNR